jgi:hypothetical protein
MWPICVCFLAVVVIGVVWECIVCKVLVDRNYYGEYFVCFLPVGILPCVNGRSLVCYTSTWLLNIYVVKGG